MFCPFATTGAGRLVVHIDDGPKLVVNCKVKLVTLVGQVRITFGPPAVIASWGPVTGKEMLKMVPFAELPPADVVP